MTALEPVFAAESEAVEIVVEDAPRLPAEWDEAVPSSIVTSDGPGTVSRLVIYRMPIAHHARGRADLEDTLWSVLLDQLAAIWHVSPDDLDPRS